jgi:stringent starvation protein A
MPYQAVRINAMVNIASRKSGMILYSFPLCAYCHRARLVLTEKGVSADVEYVDINEPCEDLIELNPYSTMPTMIDRDLVLFDSRIIMEYLDERFPHPPLHPLDPVARAQARMLIQRIDEDWYRLLDEIETSGEKKAGRAKKMLRESLIAAAPIFKAKPYFMSDDFSLVDCVLAPLLWRLPSLNIELPKQAGAIVSYADRIFARDSFRASLSDEESDLRDLAVSVRLSA